MTKIAYAGFDLLSPALKTLLEEGCQLTELFTCPVDGITELNQEVIAMAEKAGAPWTMKRIGREDILRLKEKGCQMLVSAAYYYRIPIDEGLPMVNIHPSLLPMGRGAWPMPLQILRGDRIGGVTVHKLEEEFDTGNILLQRSFPIGERENLETLTEKIRALLPEMMKELTGNFSDLYKKAKPQGEGKYEPCPTEADWTIDQETDSCEADRILRAFYGFPCIYQGDGKRYELLKGRICREGIMPVKGGWIQAETVKEIVET